MFKSNKFIQTFPIFPVKGCQKEKKPLFPAFSPASVNDNENAARHPKKQNYHEILHVAARDRKRPRLQT